jgi:tetratricopeptide (TPR) repeat protein
VGTLRNYVPDGFAMGSALFFLAIEKYVDLDNDSPNLKETLSSCVAVLTECLGSPWALISAQSKMMCLFARGKSYQRLAQHDTAIADFTAAIAVVEESFEGEEDKAQAAYSYFRRAWSFKVGVSSWRCCCDDVWRRVEWFWSALIFNCYLNLIAGADAIREGGRRLRDCEEHEER